MFVCGVALLSGCTAKVHTDVSLQEMSQYSQDHNDDTPGLEEMQDDDQGVIYI